MHKRLLVVVSILVLFSLLVAACAAPAGAPGAASDAKKLKVGLVTDVGGVNDKSFNQSAWAGVQKAMAELGVDA